MSRTSPRRADPARKFRPMGFAYRLRKLARALDRERRA